MKSKGILSAEWIQGADAQVRMVAQNSAGTHMVSCIYGGLVQHRVTVLHGQQWRC